VAGGTDVGADPAAQAAPGKLFPDRALKHRCQAVGNPAEVYLFAQRGALLLVCLNRPLGGLAVNVSQEPLPGIYSRLAPVAHRRHNESPLMRVENDVRSICGSRIEADGCAEALLGHLLAGDGNNKGVIATVLVVVVLELASEENLVKEVYALGVAGPHPEEDPLLHGPDSVDLQAAVVPTLEAQDVLILREQKILGRGNGIDILQGYLIGVIDRPKEDNAVTADWGYKLGFLPQHLKKALQVLPR